jgi:hypothetical protein
MFDVKKVQEEAAKELADEAATKAKGRIKDKLRQIEQAKRVLANLNRELEDLYGEISQGG